MADMLPENKPELQAKAVAGLLTEHKGHDVSLLDVRNINNWTDFFIIATVSSRTHMDGMEKHIKDYCRENEIEILGSSRKETDDEWRLLDLGWAVIHLMTTQAREFYELERLWKNLPQTDTDKTEKR